MSTMQGAQYEGHGSPDSEGPAAAGRLFEDPREMKWCRRDWDQPVASFVNFHTSQRRSVFRDGSQMKWLHVQIPTLYLSRRASLLLLQGMRTNDLLIPNHEVRVAGAAPAQVAHLLVRAAPWHFWYPVPALHDLHLALLGDVPPGIHQAEVLAALAEDTAPG